MTEWLTLIEMHRHLRPGEQPVHGETVGRPVRLDHPGERRDRVFWTIDRAAYHQIETCFGAKQTRHMKRKNATAEVAKRRGHAPGSRRDLHRIEATPSIPNCTEARGTKDFPTMGVGDTQWQATVSVSRTGVIHPIPFHRC